MGMNHIIDKVYAAVDSHPEMQIDNKEELKVLIAESIRAVINSRDFELYIQSLAKR